MDKNALARNTSVCRIEWVDALRALAMFFVVYGHQVKGRTEYFVFTSPIKICLFFAISGYVIKNDNVSEKTFYINLFRKLIIPWLFFSLVPYAVIIPIKGIGYFAARLESVLLGVSVWYMPCCIIAEIVWHYLNRLIKNTSLLVGITFIVSGLGLFLGKQEILDILMINRAMTVQVYILIGYLYKKYEKTIINRIGKPLFVVIFSFLYASLGIATIIFYPGQNINVHNNRYYSLLICGLMIVIGIVCLFIFAEKYIKWFPKPIVIMGQNTLVIYLCSDFVFTAIHFISNRLGINNKGIISGLISAIIACTVCTYFSLIIKKFIPEILGLKRNRDITVNRTSL